MANALRSCCEDSSSKHNGSGNQNLIIEVTALHSRGVTPAQQGLDFERWSAVCSTKSVFEKDGWEVLERCLGMMGKSFKRFYQGIGYGVHRVAAYYDWRQRSEAAEGTLAGGKHSIDLQCAIVVTTTLRLAAVEESVSVAGSL